MRTFSKYLIVLLGAIGVWRLLSILRGQTIAIDPKTLILRPEEAQRAGRFLPMKSIANLRDIGGYQTADGHTVRWNRVYRGASLSAITPEDSQALVDLGLKLVCDLRTEEEITAAPDIVPSTMEYMHLPLKQDSGRMRQLRLLLFERNKLGDTLVDLYTRVMVDGNADVIGKILRRVADENALPMMIHCTAGKDRTGIAIAVLLRLLDVPEQTVLEDYSLSNLSYEYFRTVTAQALRQLSYFGISEAEARPLLLANPATMELVFRHIEASYGTVEKYVKSAVGLDDAAIAKIRANMLE